MNMNFKPVMKVSPRARGSAAPGIAAAESAKASGRGTVAARSTEASPAPPAAAQQIAQEYPCPESSSAATSAMSAPTADNREHEEDDKNDESPRESGTVLGIVNRVRWQGRPGHAHLFALGLRDRAADALRGGEQRLPIMPGLQFGTHVEQDLPVETIRKHRLQCVADLEAAPVFIGHQQQLDAVVRALLTDSEMAKQIDAEVFERLIIEALDGHQRNLRAGRLLQRSAVPFNRSAAFGIHHSSEIAHVTLRLQRIDIDGENARAQECRNHNDSKKRKEHETLSVAPARTPAQSSTAVRYGNKEVFPNPNQLNTVT
jgi:hypothetical protein